MGMGVIPVGGCPVLHLKVILIFIALSYLIRRVSIIFKINVKPMPVSYGWFGKLIPQRCVEIVASFYFNNRIDKRFTPASTS